MAPTCHRLHSQDSDPPHLRPASWCDRAFQTPARVTSAASIHRPRLPRFLAGLPSSSSSSSSSSETAAAFIRSAAIAAAR
eukprot:CAMPEP_0181374102 /NCGR_PEP_ID=MMETSP1106-20121128/15801_1 /TAXON_ID=81844 /ORGANISM="Mantoniella antarctica, Strain SL-175" /LENGTH=79 /DNA_ID=CAMNT_0023491981 /DNA_START=280 /DNA_END=515 /DNA_ORIENTATION=-